MTIIGCPTQAISQIDIDKSVKEPYQQVLSHINTGTKEMTPRI